MRTAGLRVAYSLYGGPVPQDSLFGKTTTRGREVLCTNPASLRGGSGNLDAIQPSEPYAPDTTIGGLTAQIGYITPAVPGAWIEADDAYRARCVTENGASVLRATPQNGAPTLRALPAENWGLHLADANLPLGNLAALAKRQISVYEKENEAE